MASPSPTPVFRPDIEGLRAIAVLAVILFHFSPAALPSGFLGVDVFFVISGFVITGSLARHPQSRLGPFLLEFYARRVKRLLPLLIVCVLVTALLGALVITPGSEEELATWQTGLAALFGAGNLVLQAQQFDYFAASTHLNLFTHTWSLGVEEQFYLLFPILVFASGFARGAPRPGRRLALPLALLSLASLIGWFALNGQDPRLAYYFFPVRFWELAAGALAFLAWRAWPVPPRLASSLPGALVAVALVVALALSRVWATFSTVAVVLLTALLLWGLQPGQLTSRLLSTAPMRELGRLSYALYLWHWSVLSLSAWTVGIHPWTVPFQLALILALAIWSHHAIENPLRRARWGGTPPRTLLLGLLAVGGSTLLLFPLGQSPRGQLFLGDRTRADRTPWQKRVAIAGSSVIGVHCHNAPEVPDGEFTPYERRCTTPPRPGDRQRLFVLGDSHALALLPLEERLHAQLPLRITHYSRNGCPMPPSASQHGEGGCWTFSQQALASVLAAVRPGDLVLVHNYFRSHFGEGDDSRAMQIDARGRPVEQTAAKVASYGRALVSLAETLAAKDVSLLIVADVPRFLALKRDRNLCVRQWFRPWLPAACLERHAIPVAAHEAENRPHRRMLARLEATHANVHVFDPAALLCAGGVCRSHDARGQPLYRDRDHLEARAAQALAQPLEEFLRRRRLLWDPETRAAGHVN
ncbi:MAG: acyltransferase family protein [Cyanobacteriota bacterium]|nr:acyltransferase family protein [Cyanobacteriota bacterium]